MPRSSRVSRSRRSRRALAAAALTLPLITVPIAAPAVAAVSVVDAHGYFGGGPGGWATAGYGGYGYGGYEGYGFGGGSYGGSGGYGSYGGSYGGGYGYDGGTSQTQNTATQDATSATSEESKGVVLIDTVLDYGQGEAAGTGLVIGSDGTVVTNHHVVADATSITVTVPSTGKKYTATVVGYDATHDVAVLKLADATGLSTVTTDRSVSVGEAVTAVGNAEGGGALTAADGTVTVRRKTIDVSDDDGGTEHLKGLIEDNADVVSGDSGGALLSGADQVVGMNVAASSGSSQVTGYAIPVARVLRIAGKIEAGQASKTITIGSKAALGVEVSSQSSAPYIVGVVSGGPADKAGIAAGDTITSVAGAKVGSYTALTSRVATLEPGQRVAVTWTDQSGASHTGTVTLGTAPVG